MRQLNGSYLASLIDYPDPSRFSHLTIDDIVINSLSVRKGSMFVAMKGEHTDGHRFIRDAVHRGASLILAASSKQTEVEVLLSGLSCSVLFVDNPLAALQKMAKGHIERHHSITKVGITGSCGKTTTKEMVASILSLDGETAKNPGNYNSEIGLALSAFTITDETKYSVFEMGIDRVGEMDTMIDMYRPHVSLITNIGLSHVGKLGAVAMTAKEKGKIFHSEVEASFMNDASRWVSFISQRQGVDVTRYGMESAPVLHNLTSLHLDGWKFDYQGQNVHLKAIGRHNMSDALAAIAIAESIGLGPSEIAEGLNRFIPVEGRSKVSYGNVTLIEDWYNSSLDSTRSILECISRVPVKGQKRIVLGSMKEMGSYGPKAHEFVSRKLKESGDASIYLYGEEMKSAYDYLKRSSGKENVFITEEYDRLQERVMEDTRKGDLVLLKGSRAMQMERLVPAIQTIG